jgi:hypothetical protein
MDNGQWIMKNEAHFPLSIFHFQLKETPGRNGTPAGFSPTPHSFGLTDIRVSHFRRVQGGGGFFNSKGGEKLPPFVGFLEKRKYWQI